MAPSVEPKTSMIRNAEPRRGVLDDLRRTLVTEGDA